MAGVLVTAQVYEPGTTGSASGTVRTAGSTACSRSNPSTGARRRSRIIARSSSRTCPLVGSYTRQPSPVRAQCQDVVPRHERSDEQRHRPARQRGADGVDHLLRGPRPTCRPPAAPGTARPPVRGPAATAPHPRASCPAPAARTCWSRRAPASGGRRSAPRTRADSDFPPGGASSRVTSAGSAHAASATSTALPQVVPSTWSRTAPACRCSPIRSDTSGRRSTVDVSLATSATSATGVDRRGRTRDNTFPTCRPNPDTVRMTPNLTSARRR